VPIGTATFLALGAAGALAKGAGQISAARATKLSREEKDELKDLQRLRERGQLGLTEEQAGKLDQTLLGQRGGLLREQQQQTLQQQASSGRPLSGRDIFLREQATQRGQQELLQQENTLRMQADEAAAASQQARMQALRGQQMQTKAATRAAIGDTVGNVLGQAGELGMMGAAGKIDPNAFGGEGDAWLQALIDKVQNSSSATTGG